MKFYNYLVENNEYQLYVDMDGVITDFISSADKVARENGYSRKWAELADRNPNFAWKLINEKGSEFWKNLDWERNGKKLWSYIEKYNPIILSAYPWDIKDVSVKTEAIIGKKEWINKNIGLDYANTAIICARDEKQMFANEGSILIDDMKENIKEWTSAGGAGILHKSYRKTIRDLEGYYNEIL